MQPICMRTMKAYSICFSKRGNLCKFKVDKILYKSIQAWWIRSSCHFFQKTSEHTQVQADHRMTVTLDPTLSSTVSVVAVICMFTA